MLPKPNRLPGYLIPSLLNTKTTHHGPLFSLKVLAASRKTPVKIGFIVSSKIAKSAAARNRLKRLLRAALLSHLSSLKPNYYLVFLAKHPLKAKTLDQIKPHIASLLKNAKLVTKEPNENPSS